PDPKEKGLLFAGTESHLYISYDDGDHWLPFQLNLAAVPVTDLTFQKEQDDLVIATQGRAFYVLDEMPLVRALNPAKFSRSSDVVLFPIKRAIRIDGGGFGFGPREPDEGTNPPSGAVLYYYLKDKPQDVKIRVLTADGKLVREIDSKPKPGAERGDPDNPFRRGPALASTKAGFNRVVWDLRYEDATGFPGLLMWDGSLRGPVANPGDYKAELIVDGKTYSQNFSVVKDPRAPTTPEDFDKQLTFALKIRDRVSEANQSVIDIRAAEGQLKPYLTSSNDQVKKSAKDLSDQLTVIEEAIYQTKLKAGEDALNYPIKLNNKLAAVENVVEDTDIAPTAQSYQVYDQLNAQLQTQLDSLHKIETSGIANFNKLIRDQNIPAVTIPRGSAPAAAEE
ncbi:MAG: hypothetical protein WBD46_10945, partial [Acidobacteriaceae bacterium]